MEILPTGNLRIVFAAATQLVDCGLEDLFEVRPNIIQHAARRMEAAGLLSFRTPEEDPSANTIFGLAGTTKFPFPVALEGTLDLPTGPLERALRPFAQAFLGEQSPFGSFAVRFAVLRVFGNGYGGVSMAVDFERVGDMSDDEYAAYLSRYFAYSAADQVAFRDNARAALNRLLPGVCETLLAEARLPAWRSAKRAWSANLLRRLVRQPPALRGAINARLSALSTLYVSAGDWRDCPDNVLHLDSRLRTMLQGEPGEAFVNQSPSHDELVIFSSGYHIYIYNKSIIQDSAQRAVGLTAFLNLMNMLYRQLSDIKDLIRDFLAENRTPWRVRSDIDEKIEVLYSQVMVSAPSWRRDFSSFADQVNRRWRLQELKQFCLTLFAAWEARSARRRAVVVTWVLGLIAATQIFSAAEDSHDLYDRYRGDKAAHNGGGSAPRD